MLHIPLASLYPHNEPSRKHDSVPVCLSNIWELYIHVMFDAHKAKRLLMFPFEMPFCHMIPKRCILPPSDKEEGTSPSAIWMDYDWSNSEYS